MYVIKMESDKSLVCTVHANIFEGDSNADSFVFIIPKFYNGKDLTECSIVMRYILPSGGGQSEELNAYCSQYNNNYNQYRVDIGSRFTNTPGEIIIWLTAFDYEHNTVFRTSEISVHVAPNKDIIEYMPDDTMNQIDALAARIDMIQREKADGIYYDNEARELHLTSRGQKVGESVIVPSDDYTDKANDNSFDTWIEIEDDSQEELNE